MSRHDSSATRWLRGDKRSTTRTRSKSPRYKRSKLSNKSLDGSGYKSKNRARHFGDVLVFFLCFTLNFI